MKANDCDKGPYGHICDTQDRKIPRSSKTCQGKCTYSHHKTRFLRMITHFLVYFLGLLK